MSAKVNIIDMFFWGNLYKHRLYYFFFFLVVGGIDVQCPAEFPNVFDHGRKCCQSTRVSIQKGIKLFFFFFSLIQYQEEDNNKEGCNGGFLTFESTCCFENKEVPCPKHCGCTSCKFFNF